MSLSNLLKVQTELNEVVSYSFELLSYQVNDQCSPIKKAMIPLPQKM